MSAELTWNGDAIIARIQAACVAAVDETNDAAVEIAQRLVRKDTRTLMKAIKRKNAVIQGDRVIGSFGVHQEDDPGYALAQEFLPEVNTPVAGPDGTTPRRKARGRPYLRPAKYQAFPTLDARIRSHLR